MSVTTRLESLGYTLEPMPIQVMTFHAAVRTGNLVFTSGQVPSLGDTHIKGKVGDDIDVETAAKAAEVCAINCLRAIAAVADVDNVLRIVKVLGMVNVAPGFDDTSAVINGATSVFNDVFGAENTHARSAVGMTIPQNWAVEVEAVAELKG